MYVVAAAFYIGGALILRGVRLERLPDALQQARSAVADHCRAALIARRPIGAV